MVTLFCATKNVSHGYLFLSFVYIRFLQYPVSLWCVNKDNDVLFHRLKWLSLFNHIYQSVVSIRSLLHIIYVVRVSSAVDLMEGFWFLQPVSYKTDSPTLLYLGTIVCLLSQLRGIANLPLGPHQNAHLINTELTCFRKAITNFILLRCLILAQDDLLRSIWSTLLILLKWFFL